MNLPICLLSRRDEKGRDCSTYLVDNLELQDTCKQSGRQEGRPFTEDDILVPITMMPIADPVRYYYKILWISPLRLHT